MQEEIILMTEYESPQLIQWRMTERQRQMGDEFLLFSVKGLVIAHRRRWYSMRHHGQGAGKGRSQGRYHGLRT